MVTEIKDKLLSIEKYNGVKILYACESGSRAWGFESTDSDFDVRFIYAHHQDFYLSINEFRDVIELPVNEVLDISGWDIRKALRLFRNSNAPVYEWLQSPVIYQKEESFHSDIWDLSKTYFSEKTGMHHYLNMTINCFESELQTGEVKLKKYFYALRPILACKWIALKQEVPPMEFSKLLTIVKDKEDIIQAINELLGLKKLSDEKKKIKRMDLINEYIREEISLCVQAVKQFENKNADSDKLNQLFRKYILW